MGRQMWSKADECYLRELNSKKTVRELAKIMGRSCSAVERHIRAMGLQRYSARNWRPEEDALLREMEGDSVTVVSTRIGRSPLSVRGRARRLGVRLKFDGQKPVPSQAARKRRQTCESVPAKVRRAPSESRLEWCSQCHAPVSNWQEHFERMGHRRPVAA